MKHIGILFLLLFLHSCQNKVDWHEYYESQYKSPYGLYIYEKELESEYKKHPKKTFNIIKTAPYPYLEKNYYDIEDDSITKVHEDHAYIYINNEFRVDSLFQDHLFYCDDFENLTVISVRSFDDSLCKKFNIELKRKIIKGDKPTTFQLSGLYFDSNKNSDRQSKTYHIKTLAKELYYFDQLPVDADILGRFEYGDSTFANLIRVYSGEKGGYLLHLAPELFTNYHLLHEKDYQYAFDFAGYFSSFKNVHWDGYRTHSRHFESNSQFKSTFLSNISFFMSKKPLRNGFLLFMSIFVLMLLFNYKRIQKAIPIYIAKHNNTLKYIETLTHLFLHERNYKALAMHRIHYLLERIRTMYYQNTETLDTDFIERLSEKSHIDRSLIHALVQQIEFCKTNDLITKKEFIKLSKLIHQFNHKN